MPVFISSESDEVQSVFDWLRGKCQPTPERYMRGMAFLELLWQQTVPGLSFKVVHDEPDQLPGDSTRVAMALFAALRQNPNAQKWFVKHIRNAVVHSREAADAIAVDGDSIHFYQVKEVSKDLGTQLFDRLSLKQKQDFAQLYAGRDARKEFSGFVNSEVILSQPDDNHLRELFELIEQLPQARSSTVRLATAPEFDHSGNGGRPNDEEWPDELNERRIELIDKDIQGDITAAESVELAELQRKAILYRDRMAPLPIEGARRLHQQLLEMKRRQEGG